MSPKYLNMNISELEQKGAFFTAREIQGQPDLWQKTFQFIKNQKNELDHFLTNILKLNELTIVLTGAGTSAFIGESAEGPFQRNTGKITRAIPTTDIVTHPEFFLQRHKPILMISFARSGNSPESVQAVKVSDQVCDQIYHLIITCNPDGKLAKYSSQKNSFVFVLPSEADDQSLAMTGSFSSMLLTALLISDIHNLDKYEKTVTRMAEYAKHILAEYLDQLRHVAALNFNRAVFLGSGPLQGVARESHLKLQELTDGGVVCKHDSYLGFRHGPKAVVNDKTLMIYLFSNKEFVQQYEKDLLQSVNGGQRAFYSIAVMEHHTSGVEVDLLIEANGEQSMIPEEFWAVCSVLPAQIIGFFKSLNSGLKPDTPSESGAISRVVEGVTLYPHFYE